MADESQAQTLAAENPEALRELDLRYVSDAEPGFSRRRFGKGFSYGNGRGEPLRDPATLKWIRSLAIPPAWRDVWISPHRNGHLLAAGRDLSRAQRVEPVGRDVQK